MSSPPDRLAARAAAGFGGCVVYGVPSNLAFDRHLLAVLTLWRSEPLDKQIIFLNWLSVFVLAISQPRPKRKWRMKFQSPMITLQSSTVRF